jgi:membrane protein implicated in regulation of membrane protease activity
MSEAPSTLVTVADTLSELLYAAGSALALLVGVVATAAGLVSGLSGDTVPGGIFLAVGITFLLVGTATTRRGRRRLARRLGPTAFGRRPTVESRVVRPEESFDGRCARCDTSVERGAVRRYREETLVAGVPVYTHETGENAYCLDCALDEFGVGDDPEDTDADTLDALAERDPETTEATR